MSPKGPRILNIYMLVDYVPSMKAKSLTHPVAPNHEGRGGPVDRAGERAR